VSAAIDLNRLRSELEKRFGSAIRPLPGEAPERERPGFRTGVRALDQLLPGGVPRRAVTLWTGEATSGRTAAVRALVEAACREALVALVDATCTLDPAAWCGPDGHSAPGLWVARPPAPGHAGEGAWVAEQLLRTGAFGLVVLDGPAPDATELHRLRALARETDAALLVSTAGAAPGWRADARLEFRREAGAGTGLRTGARFRRRSGVRLAKGSGARGGEREVELVHEPTHRLHPPAFAPDRRAASWT
jgi:RecA DNA recombination protein